MGHRSLSLKHRHPKDSVFYYSILQLTTTRQRSGFYPGSKQCRDQGLNYTVCCWLPWLLLASMNQTHLGRSCYCLTKPNCLTRSIASRYQPNSDASKVSCLSRPLKRSKVMLIQRNIFFVTLANLFFQSWSV